MQIEDFDAVVVGSGEAGKFMAWQLGAAGERVAVVEQRWLGGACPNMACLPSKNILHAAAVARTVATSELFGTRTTGHAVSMKEVQERKRRMVDGLLAMHHARFAQAENEVVMGHGSFVGDRTVAVTTADGPRTLRGRRVFLDLGATAAMPPIPGLDRVDAMTHIELLARETLPPALVILGGGYVGLELGQAMARLGSRVTILEAHPRLLHREDPDISEAVAALLRDEGITVETGVRVERITPGIAVHANVDGRQRTFEGSDLLVALGKTPGTRGAGLEHAGVRLTTEGHVQVNDRLETTAPGVWAMGDCAGSPPFTHMSFDDFRVVRDNLAGGARTTRGRQVPSSLFLDPELARVGMNESDAKRAGIPYRLAEIPASAILRTRTTGEVAGKLKLLVGTDDRILGFTALAPRAGELLPVVQLAMAQGLPFRAIEALTIAHPTYAEGLVTICGAVR